MENRFYKVDLHVHTPASKCFEGDKSDNGYWEILKCAVRNEVRAIAITDHNTLAGYETLINLRKQTKKEYEIVQKYNIPEEDKNALKEKIELFEKVYILLGVEITLDPGVHIIVLCGENEKAELSELLDEIGYTSDRRGSDSDVSPNVDIKNFLKNPKLQGKIVYAPHVDSDKGIWNNLSGRYREEIFSTNCINAISCNNPSQLSRIKKLVAAQPGYIRKKPFAYINASDAHRESDVGSKYSFFSLNEFSFEEVKKAFEAPEEKISDIERPGFISFVDKCIENNKSVFVNTLEELPKSICAILNSGYGYVLLGITAGSESRSYSGINIGEEELHKIINSSISRLSTANQGHARINVGFISEKVGTGKWAFAISIRDYSYGLWVLDKKEAYILGENGSVKLASVDNIAAIVRENVLNKLQAFNKRNDAIIKDAMNKMAQASFPITKYVLFDKLSSRSIPFDLLFDVTPIYRNKSSKIGLDEIAVNGDPDGNMYFVYDVNPRLEDACLRYSCPQCKCKDEEYISHLKKFQGPAIIISSCGGCFLVDTTDAFYIEALGDALVLTPNETFKEEQISMYHIIAWLKSSFCMWACLEDSGSVNYYKADAFHSLFFANNSQFVKSKDIETLVKSILEKEHQFLVDTIKYGEDDDEEFSDLCIAHNNLISQISYRLESIIQDIYQIADEDIALINDDLVAEKIYTILPCDKSLDE